MGSRKVLFTLVTIFLVLISIAYANPLQYRFPIVVLCSSSLESSIGSSATLLNISCNFRSSRKENLTSCGEPSSFNFTLVPVGSSSVSYCVAFNTLRNATTFDSDGVLEFVSAVSDVTIDAVVLLAQMPQKSKIPVFDEYSDFIYTARSSMIVNVLQRPSDDVKQY